MTRFLARTAFALLLGFQVAQAADTTQRAFNIKAQTLASALSEFARQSKQEILFAPEIVAQKRTNGVQGNLEPLSALSTLLKNTGLQFTTTPKGAILVSERQTSALQPTGIQLAQVQPAQATEATERKTVIPPRAGEEDSGEVVVTGKHIGIVNEGIIPRQENEAVRYEVFTREEIDRSGATSLSELLTRQVSQAANFGTDTQQILGSQLGNSGGIQTTGDTINLRGFGSGQTLILVNGRRLYGSEYSGPDISRIPLRAVERIEISPSSGSAIYGANAMAGVINIILRKDFSGSEFGVYLGGADGGANEERLNLMQGFALNNHATNITVSAEYKKTSALDLGDRNYHLRAIQHLPREVVGDTVYLNEILQYFLGPRANLYSLIPSGLGIPSNPSARIATVPAGFDGNGLTLAMLNPTAGVASLNTKRLDDAHLVQPSTSASLFATLEHDINGDRLGAYAELSYRWADASVGDFADYAPPIFMMPDHPLNTLGTVMIVMTDATIVPRAHQESDQNSYRAVAGLKGLLGLGGRDWRWSIDASWDRNETNATTVRYTELLPLAAANQLYNPLRDLTNAPMLPQSMLDDLRGTTNLRGNPEIAATNWRANGELFDLPGGHAAISFGAEYRHEYLATSQTATYGAYKDLPQVAGVGFYPTGDWAVRSTRDSYAGYAELTLPVLRTVDVAAAMRYEKYDDFDAAMPPMLAVKWQLLPDVALRAQFSQGFQPPTQDSLTSVGYTYVDDYYLPEYLEDPLRPGLQNASAITIAGGQGNPDLKPETSDTWDAGVILTPRFAPGLTINASYFRYDKKDRTGSLRDQEYVDAGNVVRGDNLPGDPAGVPGPIIQINEPIVNIARQFTDGWDFAADYRFDLGGGTVRVSADATWTRSFYQQGFPGASPVDSLGYLGRASGAPIKLRGRGGVSWTRGEWGANWNVRYYGPFKVDSNIPDIAYTFDGFETPSTLEQDLQLQYRMDGGANKWLAGTKWTLGINNVFDREPGYITDFSSLWYNYFSDPRQRYVYLDVRKSF